MASSFSSSSGSGSSERDEASPNFLHLPLKEFLECFPPPQSGRMIDGYYPDFDDDTFNIKPGTVLNFHRQVSPNVPLSFRDPWGGDKGSRLVKVTLPLEFQGRFKSLPYDPDSDDMSPDHVYQTAEDLLRSFPVYVQANASYRFKNEEDDDANDLADWEQHLGECSFQCGDRLKLIRLVHKYGQKVIECRLLGEARLMLLPMDCVGNFTVVPDDNEYMLSDLLSMLPRKRRLQIADSTRKQHKIPGVPADFHGDLYLEEPEAFVEASPIDDPGLILGLPNTLDVNIAPEENAFERGQLLNTFATNNRNLFPVVARVTDWDEETTILENHFVRPGIELVIHGWTRQSKILAIAGDKYYAIPLTYQGRFRIKPQQFHGAADLENAHPAYKIRVVEIDPEDVNTSISPGDVLRIIRQDSLHRNAKGTDRGQYLKCEKLEGIGRGREIKIPLTSTARFEEIVEDNKSDDYAIRELVTFVTDTEELVVDLLQGSLDQKIDDRDLPLNGLPITLCDFIVEPAVYVSVETTEAPAFHIPLRTLMYVTFIQQLEKLSSPLLTKQNPRLSTLDRCVEILPHDVFSALRPQGERATITDALPNLPSVSPNWDKRDQLSVLDSASTTTGLDYEPVPPRDKNQLRMVQSFAQSKKWTPHYGIDDTESQLSFASKADYGSKPKGFAAKLKNKFRRHKSTENLRPGSPNLSVVSGGPKSQQLNYLARYDSVDLSAPQPMVVHTTTPRMVANGHVARSEVDAIPEERVIDLDTNELATWEPLDSPESDLNPEPKSKSKSSSSHRKKHREGPPSVVGSVRSTSVRNAQPQQQAIPMATQGGMMMSGGQQFMPVMQPGGGYMMMPVQPGGMGGYMMMPTMPQPVQTMGGYMMVPIMQPQQQQQQMMQTSNLVHKHQSAKSSNSSSSIEDEDVESASVDYSDINFSKSQQFKVAIPSNGNLYHFSVKKMADFFHQLKVNEDCVRTCVKQKIDGKKFAKMTESDLERHGLMHPVVVHFRRQTFKQTPNFML